jgi:quinol monooxygenase YgiN
MIIVTARMKVKTGNKKFFISEAQDLISATRKENGCISYNLLASTEDENVLVMLEQWKDKNSLNKHMETDHFKQFGDTIEHLLSEEIDIQSYSVKVI